MMKKLQSLVWLLLLLAPMGLFAQYPPLEFNIGHSTTSATASTVDVYVTAGTNWQNITSFRGTFTFNPAIITWNSMQSWSLSNPGGASFSSPSAGVVTFVWNSLISVGPTIPNGSNLFVLRFNVVGAPGDVSPIGFASSPQQMYWNNGFGWSGNNFQQTNGSVTLICQQPVASFSHTANLYNYAFTSTGSGAQQYLWDFGDGGTATTANPTHTYASTGNYTVCLITTNGCGADTTCQSFNVCPHPNAWYSYAINQLAVAFTNSSSNNPTSYSWDFGDGGTSTLASPNHTYALPGTYTVCMIADNGCAADTACQTFTVGCPSPQAMWADSTSDLIAFLTDLSSNQPTSWLWDFGDGNFSSLPAPFHSYAAPGTYMVCLTVASICGTDSSCAPVTVSCAAPVAAFTQVISGSSVQFTDGSTINPTSWSWDFGDGNTSTLQNPSHIYAVDGNYSVCLIASSICGADTLCGNLTINTVGVDPGWRADLSISPNPASDILRIQFPGAISVKLYGLHGELQSQTTADNALQLSLGNLSRGIYFLEVCTAEGVAVQKVVLR